MKRLILLLASLCASLSATAQNVIVERVEKPVEWVNILMGTDSDFSLSNGNTYPAIARPWGMNFWTPQTGKMGDGWAYTYSARKIRGFKQTHQPSPWINDYGQFALMPTCGEIVTNQDKRASWFSHKTETATPYYYSVYLADYDITTELTPTERAMQMRVTYPKSDNANLVIDMFDGGSYIKVDKEAGRIIGYTTKNSGGVPENFRNYVVITLDRPIESFVVWEKDSLINGKSELKGEHVGAVVSFSTERGEQVGIKCASSFISYEQAWLNLNREIGDKSFDQTKQEGYDTWNKELGRIEVSGGEYDDIKVFYSSLYRLLLFPRMFYEIDAADRVMHYSPYNGEVLPGYMFTDNGFWDTFRAVFPFLETFYPTMTSRIMEGLVHTYNESGWLPEWMSPGHRDCMIGSNSAVNIASAYMRGIDCYDIETLFEAMLKSAGNEGPLGSVGRMGADYYNKLGYVPYNVGVNENVARTLEYAYADYGIMKVAEKSGKNKRFIERFKSQAQNWRNVFDPESGLMRGRNKDGSFQSPFNPFKWGDAFTEGNSWHYTWSVMHDIKGLADAMGGKERFAATLDTVFTVPPIFDDSYYGFPIHEIREMQIAGMGNYAHGNQPIQHAIYLYDYVGQPWKAQARSREVMKRMYAPTPDGYCGDEDNGQTSAWFVFSAIGFYPVSPIDGDYMLGSPLFRKAVLHLENGKTFTVNAPANNGDNVYIVSATLNGVGYDKNYLPAAVIDAGGSLDLVMGDKPNYERGTGDDAAPLSMSQRYEIKIKKTTRR